MYILEEDLFEDLTADSTEEILSAPEQGEDIGIAELLMNLIKDEYEAIQGYNEFLANLRSHEEMRSTIEDIITEENTHIGQLQTLLQTISPNVEAIEQGKEEAEKILDKEVDSISTNESLNEDYDEADLENLSESFEVKENDYTFEVVKSTYRNNNLPFLALAIKDAETKKEDIGGIWSDISVNLDGLKQISDDKGLCFALDNDFNQFASDSLKKEVLEKLTTNEIIATIPSGYVDFKVYKLKDNILNSIRTIDEFEDEIRNQEN